MALCVYRGTERSQGFGGQIVNINFLVLYRHRGALQNVLEVRQLDQDLPRWPGKMDVALAPSPSGVAEKVMRSVTG
jgi:hypothetical protein